MNLSSLSDVNSTMLSPSGKFLYYDGAQWDVKSIKVQELADVEAGMGAGKVMVGRSDGTKFEFADYTLDGLTNVNSTGKGVGSVLVWKGDALGWKVDTNKISDINELDGFNIANPSNKYMYHDGTEWIAKELNILTTMKDLTDTNIVNEADNQIVYYDLNTQKWRNSALTIGSPGNTGLIGDIELDWAGQGSAPSKKFLVYSNSKWRNAEVGINEMKDVSITSATDGQVMVWDNGNWVNQDPKSKVSSLTDVSLSNLADGQVLEYDSATQKWINKSAASNLSMSEISSSQTNKEIDILGHLVQQPAKWPCV